MSAAVASESVCLVTGATGSLGRSIVAELLHRGGNVRALVRPTSRTQAQSELAAMASDSSDGSISFVVGDLSDASSLDGLLNGVSHVIHAAAQLGDWGPWSRFENGIVDATGHLVDACMDSDIERFVHVGSVAAYGHPRGNGPWDESLSLGQNLWWWDHYARAKMLSEQQAMRLRDHATLVRPTWIVGPADRTILPRIIAKLARGDVSLLGDGNNHLNMVLADDVARSIVEACQRDEARGKTYNLCSDGEITQRAFFDLLADHLGCDRVTKSVPKWVAHHVGFLSECFGHLTNSSTPPQVTRHGISLITRPTSFRSEAAKHDLDWRAGRPIGEGLIEALNAIAARQTEPTEQPELARQWQPTRGLTTASPIGSPASLTT
ncbi:MAG: NAD-dependent epimerase/dehydratase family protein [Planctomycetota bacterium]